MEIGFAQWMLVGVPIAVVMMILTWVLLTKVVFRPEIDNIPGGKELIRDQLRNMGPMSQGEIRVMLIFILAATLWAFVPIGTDLLIEFGVLGAETEPPIEDAGIAMLVAPPPFLLPAGGDAK